MNRSPWQLLEKFENIRLCLAGFQNGFCDTGLPISARAQKQNFWLANGMLGQRSDEIHFSCIAEDDKAFRYRQIPIPLGLVSEKALAPFLKRKEIRVGKLVVIRQNKNRGLADTDIAQNGLNHILPFGTRQSFTEALVAAFSSGLDCKIGKMVCFCCFTHIFDRIIAYLFAISAFPGAK